jgi:hypothetical protein
MNLWVFPCPSILLYPCGAMEWWNAAMVVAKEEKN